MKLPRSLIEGHRRFLRDKHAPERGRYIQLAELGQAPTATAIACCDARVDISAIFDTEPGELFILRNVANLVPPYEPEGKYHGTSAGIEFAVQGLKVPHLIVLGHSHCGGVAAYRQKVRDKVTEGGFIGSWLTMLDNLKIDESEIFEFGDETAFLELYRRRQAAIYRFLSLMTGSATSAEDILQEVFVVLLRDQCTFDPDRVPKENLRAIADSAKSG